MGRRKKKHKGLRAVFTLIVVLLIILAAVLVWGGQLGKTVKKKAAGAVLQQISQQAAESSDGTATGDAAAVLGQVYSNMDEADQEKLQEIIADNAGLKNKAVASLHAQNKRTADAVLLL